MKGADNMKKRNNGIDLLRILSMVYVVITHCMVQGNLIQQAGLGVVYKGMAWLINTSAYCAVDCFALISGYVGYRDGKKDLNVSRYLDIWFQVVFYNVLITFVYSVIMPGDVAKIEVLKAFFPVTFYAYWYFSAYTGLFFISPLINAAVKTTENQLLKRHAFIIFFLFSAYSLIAGHFSDPFNLSEGFCFAWIAILYFIGAVIKKTNMFSELSYKVGVCVLLFMVLFSAVARGLFVKYVSPTIVIIAIIHVLLFSRIEVPVRIVKFVKFAAPGTLAVYLINTQRLFFKYFMKGRFAFLSTKPFYVMPAVVVGFSVAFVLFAVTIDYIRRMLFRTLRIPLLISWIEKKVTRFLRILE